MSKSGRAHKHEQKMKEKRAKKAAKAALYKSLAGTSKKKKKIIARSKSRVAGTYKHAHIMADCGNPGCERCNPRKVVKR